MFELNAAGGKGLCPVALAFISSLILFFFLRVLSLFVEGLSFKFNL